MTDASGRAKHRVGLERGPEKAEDRIEFARESAFIITEIQLMVRSEADADELALLIGAMIFDDDASPTEKARLVLAKATRLIEQREARLPSYVSGVGPTDLVAGPRAVAPT
jgi:hypothetical protein